MSVHHREDSIKALRREETQKQHKEEDRDSMLLELEYNMMLLQNGLLEGVAGYDLSANKKGN